jgi:ribosomal protein L20A (L18A)
MASSRSLAFSTRAREREAELASQELDTITRDFASRGFLLPPGALFAATEGIRAKTLAGAASLSRDVALKRADLLVQNRQFTIQQVREVEALLVNMHMAAMERVLRAAQISAQFAVEVFRARLDKAKLRLEAIQTQAQTFRDAVAAEAQKVEIYRAQLQAELSKMEIDKNRVELYRAKLSGVEMLANIYRIQVQAAEAAINAERSKVETYRAEIDGYLALVRAKESEFSGYEAQLRGEQTKVQLYGEQVRARTSSAFTSAWTFLASACAVAEKNGVLQKADEAKLRAFTAKMDALKAKLAAAESYAQLGSNEEVQRTRGRLEAARLAVEAAKARVALNLDSDRFRMQAADAAVGVYKEMVVGALGALNSIASLSE